MKTILIVEDGEQILQRLVAWIQAHFFDVQVLTAKTFEAGLSIIKHNHIDIAVLDIHLTADEEGSGVQLAEAYRKKAPYNTIIFQTVLADYQYQTEIHNKIGSAKYFVKSTMTQQDFVDSIAHELKRLDAPFTNTLYLSQKDKLVPVDVGTILYFEKVYDEREVKMFCYDGEDQKVKAVILANTTLDAILKLPGTTNLFRCHKGYIVNKQMIKNTVMTETGNSFKIRYTEVLIPIGGAYRKKAGEILSGIMM